MNLITEGAITFEAEGAFYNPKMLLNRDIGVAMARAWASPTIWMPSLPAAFAG